MGGGTDTRTWRDSNGDDVAQENELGPSTNLNFGRPASVTRPDSGLKRPYQMLYSGGLQHELLPGLSASVNYYYRRYHRDFWVDNLATTFSDYTTIPIADPRGNGQTITVYSIAPAKLGVFDNLRMNTTENGRDYHAVDVSFNARIRNGLQLQGGVTTGKLHESSCQIDDPNDLRFCERSYPFLTQFKLSGTYPLPYGFRLSGLFQSVPGVQSARDAGNVGKDFAVYYSVGRAIAPGLTQPNVTTSTSPNAPGSQSGIRLNEIGSLFLDRVNQLDFAVSRDFLFGKTRVRPQVDIFNALNNNSVTQAFNTFGPSLLVPQSVLNPRLVRFNLRISF